MDRSATDQISLDEKIALIRKKNEMIVKRKQLIEKEIELAKKHNAMVDVSAPKTFEEDDGPTMYSDSVQESRREEPRRTFNNKVNYRYNNTRDEAAWRAERNEIDRERIRRQRADSGWRREWDADKCFDDDEFLREPDNRRHSREAHSREIHSRETHSRETHPREPHSRETHSRNVQPREIHSRETHPRETHLRELPAERPSHNQKPLAKRLIVPVPAANRPRGRGRPANQASANGSEILGRNSSRTAPVEGPSGRSSSKEKAQLRKSVSWDDESRLIESPRISLKDDHLLNIIIKVEPADKSSSAKGRSIELTEERGPLVKGGGSGLFDERTSLNIKDCVSKASPGQPKTQQPNHGCPPKPKEAAASKIGSDSAVGSRGKRAIAEAEEAALILAAESPLDEVDDDEWEDLSDEDWESASDEE